MKLKKLLLTVIALFSGLLCFDIILVNASEMTSTGNLIIEVVDSSSLDAIAGSEFEIYGTTSGIMDASPTATFTTNSSGIATIGNLLPNTYYLKQVSSLGHDVKTEPILVNIVSGNNSLTIENEKADGNLTIIKTDKNTSERISNVEFKLYASDGETEVVTNSSGNSIGSIVTNSNGEATINDLSYGTYYLREVSTSSGYELNSNISEVNINSETQEFQVRSTPVEVKIYKKDFNTGSNINGATIRITDATSGRLYKEFITTTSEFSLRFSTGKYILSEIIASDGYIITQENVTLNIDDSGNVTYTSSNPDYISATNNTITILNEKTKVFINTKNINNGAFLSGARIVITDISGNTLKDTITLKDIDFNSTLGASNFYITPGEYILKEVNAPTGQDDTCLSTLSSTDDKAVCNYSLIKSQLRFKVLNNGNIEVVSGDKDNFFVEANRITLYHGNESNVVIVPDTGVFVSVISIVVGAFIVYFGIMVIKNKREAY